MLKTYDSFAPAPLRGLYRRRTSHAASTAAGLWMLQHLPGLVLKLVLLILVCQWVPLYGELLGDLFTPLTEGLSFALSRL